MSSTPPEASTRNSSNPVNKLVHNILSYDSNIMLAAIISLLLVILFVLLLHIYAKWFLVQARQRSRRSVSVPQVLRPRVHHFHSFTIDTTFAFSPTSKGLESVVISSLPLFVFRADGLIEHGILECAICLSVFEDEEMGRKLPRCSHSFHVDCIDMWLNSHSTCPICRCPVMFDDKFLEVSFLPSDGGTVDTEISETLLTEMEMCDDQTSRLEIIVEASDHSENENGCKKDIVSAVCSSSMSSHEPVGDSQKRIMSRNKSERKVHPSMDGC
ncbi:hypothetical protein ACH5RR_010233 [Cinchona calisaya]|uniref:RING-type E3 ubiquitin transferase n=1 Tax=Cinchona calisaya TaxID=153742 RepID=A0ABD3AGD6_9GENT